MADMALLLYSPIVTALAINLPNHLINLGLYHNSLFEIHFIYLPVFVFMYICILISIQNKAFLIV